MVPHRVVGICYRCFKVSESYQIQLTYVERKTFKIYHSYGILVPRVQGECFNFA